MLGARCPEGSGSSAHGRHRSTAVGATNRERLSSRGAADRRRQPLADRPWPLVMRRWLLRIETVSGPRVGSRSAVRPVEGEREQHQPELSPPARSAVEGVAAGVRLGLRRRQGRTADGRAGRLRALSLFDLGRRVRVGYDQERPTYKRLPARVPTAPWRAAARRSATSRSRVWRAWPPPIPPSGSPPVWCPVGG